MSIEKNEQGRVFLSFVVENDGSITNVKVERGISIDLDKEAKRVEEKCQNGFQQKLMMVGSFVIAVAFLLISNFIKPSSPIQSLLGRECAHL